MIRSSHCDPKRSHYQLSELVALSGPVGAINRCRRHSSINFKVEIDRLEYPKSVRWLPGALLTDTIDRLDGDASPTGRIFICLTG